MSAKLRVFAHTDIRGIKMRRITEHGRAPFPSPRVDCRQLTLIPRGNECRFIEKITTFIEMRMNSHCRSACRTSVATAFRVNARNSAPLLTRRSGLYFGLNKRSRYEQKLDRTRSPKIELLRQMPFVMPPASALYSKPRTRRGG
ncbi:hypothetical protein K7H91_16505 [Martelella mediterranea]|uniref:hypothetical protein n=1 Tax=Martelella mediterranea TaxID=293089 RepID=UPI001E5C6246|nr:hypothetical protein [Martelella mediterranea]MCD1635372.1 hypothetical protein [Martelella mediterranea]